MKIILKIILITLGILIISAVFMAVGNICPPPGPYPQPPWCVNRERFVSDISFLIPEGASPPEPTVTAGSQVMLDFKISVPRTTDPVMLKINGQSIPVERETPYYYVINKIPAKSGDKITYFLSSASHHTPEQSETVVRNTTIRTGLPWTDSPVLQRSGFMKGHVIMDAGGFVADPTDRKVSSTYDTMVKDGAEWFSYDYYWTYRNYTVPEIVDEAGYIKGYPDAAGIGKMVKAVHEKGMRFFLLTELEWNILPGEAESLSWDDWFRYLNEKWSKGGQFDRQMGERLTADPADPEANAYWDRWFTQFEPFMIKAATIAEDNNIELLCLGKQLGGPMNPKNEQRWRALIRKVRAIYHGKITQTVFFSGWQKYEETMPWADELDYITSYYYSQFSKKEHPSLDELTSAMESTNRDRFDILYNKFRKPLIIITPFQSRDYAAKMEWFEPMASAPQVKQDFIAQADLYEAFFESTLDEPWLGGVFTWGYWIEPDFNPKYSFDKSSSIRSKPAELVVRKWFSTIDTRAR
jgi:hypothetical protein